MTPRTVYSSINPFATALPHTAPGRKHLVLEQDHFTLGIRLGKLYIGNWSRICVPLELEQDTFTFRTKVG